MIRLIMVSTSTGAFWGLVANALGAHPVVSLIAGVVVFAAVIVTDPERTYR